ncbi:MAG: electron transfer flavoprotein subunit alpha/FixB family protein, partial [Clostridiales bacterium]|nr:electron transfer flavoprotein subunit alpha/FixB family protein [Clostridiales bacterium]
GVFEARGETPAGDMIELLAVPAAGIRFKGRTVKAVQRVNLAAAKKVVSVGRGLGAAEHLSCVNDFAAVIGAEIGCSRPVAEEEKWLPKERYIGISGCMVKPDLYIAAGISGQVQHMVGANQSGTIVAINKDKSAPIFKQCDYGIVGDLRTVLPALTERLK